MIVKSIKLGDIEIAEQDCIEFPQGILGFEKLQQFAIVKRDQESPFYFLQSCEDKTITFICVDPFSFFPGYQVALPDAKWHDLGISDKKNIYILCLATIPTEYQKTSVNLMAPLIINLEKKCGQQVILEKGNYKTKHFLFSEAADAQQEGEK